MLTQRTPRLLRDDGSHVDRVIFFLGSHALYLQFVDLLALCSLNGMSNMFGGQVVR